MNKIVLSGYYGFANAGDEAMLTSIIETLRAEEPDIDITVLSGNREFTSQVHKVKAINRFDAWSFIRELASADLLLSGGGSLLQDVTSSRSLYYYLSVIFMGRVFGKKVMLFSQGIGPIRSALARRITKWICSGVDLITVRDDGSLDELRAMGIPQEKIIVTADAVFSLPEGNITLGRKMLSKKGVKYKPIIGFALRHWMGEEHFISEFALAAEMLRDKYSAQIVFLPLQFPADVEVADMVIGHMNRRHDVYVLREGFTTEEYLAVVSNFNLLIGMRLHALVFAALSRVPYLAVSYDPKVDRFVTSMNGKIGCNIEELSAPLLLRETAALNVVSDTQQQEKILVMRKQARENIKRAIALLPKSKRGK